MKQLLIILLLFPLLTFGETPAKSTKASVEKKADQKKMNYVSAAFKLDLTFPTGQVDTSYALHGEIRYILPWMNPIFSIALDIGYYPLSGNGTNLDPQIGLYDFDWKINSLPIYFGPVFEIPLKVPGLYAFGEAGFAMIFTWAEGETFDGTVEKDSTAYGYYFGGGLEIKLGKWGSVFGEVKQTAVYLDYHPKFNPEVGNIGGTSFLAGYRYTY